MPVYEYGKLPAPRISNYRAWRLQVGDKLSNKNGKRIVEVTKSQYFDGQFRLQITYATKEDGQLWETITIAQLERRYPILLEKVEDN